MKTIRNRYSTDRVRQVICQKDEKSLTHQAHKDECDINKILTRFAIQKVGIPEAGEQQYEDISHLQQADPATLIMESRKTLDAQGRALEKQQQEEAQAKIDLHKNTFEENKALKAQIEKLNLEISPDINKSTPQNQKNTGDH